jgi:hypothetical protein
VSIFRDQNPKPWLGFPYVSIHVVVGSDHANLSLHESAQVDDVATIKRGSRTEREVPDDDSEHMLVRVVPKVLQLQRVGLLAKGVADTMKEDLRQRADFQEQVLAKSQVEATEGYGGPAAPN